MGIGVSIVLMAAGAILRWGITSEASGFDIDAIGAILIVVGAIGFVIASLFFASFAPLRDRVVYRERDVPRDHEHEHEQHRTIRRSA